MYIQKEEEEEKSVCVLVTAWSLDVVLGASLKEQGFLLF